MPIEIKECDGGIDVIIETPGRMTDQELIAAFDDHLTPDAERFGIDELTFDWRMDCKGPRGRHAN